MIFKFLGTAAAEGIPAIFCECDVCRTARKKGGKEIRTRSQAMIDEDFLIDFNADTYMHFLQHGIDGAKIRYCFVTHSHSDHLYPKDFCMRRPGFANRKEHSVLDIYGSEAVGSTMCQVLFEDRHAGSIQFHAVQAFEEVQAGAYRVTPLTAIHDALSGPLIYLIEKEGKRILYAHDTNYLDESVWNYFKENRQHLDLVSLDCTQANDPRMRYVGHMNLNDNIRVKERLESLGCADEDTIFVCNHFSHNGQDVLREKFCTIADQHGFMTSYDGMEIEL